MTFVRARTGPGKGKNGIKAFCYFEEDANVLASDSKRE